MTENELALANSVVFLEDQIRDLRTLVRTTPRDEFATWQMVRILACLGRAVVDMTDTYIDANARAQQAIKEQPNAVE